VQLPADLRLSILEACESVPRRELTTAAQALSDSYRKVEKPAARRLTNVDALAYAATRMPATYAALRRVFSELEGELIESIRDIGAGTGAGAWAARDAFGPCEVICEEKDASMLALGRKLTPFAKWEPAPETTPDVILLSYVLGEVEDSLAFAQRAYEHAGRFLIIVEPGTTKAFKRVNQLRSLGTIVAPCPHALPCPMHAAGDWCHFSARVERTQLHRQLKGGELSHEDEKFSYLILSKQPAEPRAQARIVRHPHNEAGFIKLALCNSQGKVATLGVGKRDKDAFRRARKSAWGDRWEQPAPEPVQEPVQENDSPSVLNSRS
jgi:ribosomal protein RSM22 (predicted rRNA methylase)